ncbi:MAG: copper chaperone PCu(A)C [Gemmatimonadota bacterium]|nr:MAG: copper chaperone PCu(A)C [Gemmatimonadota bacterium]
MTIREIGQLVMVLLIGCGDPEASNTRQPAADAAGLEIYDAYAPAPAAPDVGSLYFTVVNRGSTADTLTAIETSAGGSATLHDMIHEGGLTRMHPTGPMPITPHDSLRLAPGGYHVMLSDLSRQPRVGDTITVVLSFARAGAIEFDAPVLMYTDVVRLLGDYGGSER